MKKILLFMALLFCIGLQAQNELSLLPANMQQYLGKVNKEAFEKIAGEPVGYEDGGFIVYNVINTYTKDETGIRCFYNQTTGKLVSMRFGSRFYLAYCIGFFDVKGYVDEKTNAKFSDYYHGEWHRVDYHVAGFGCQITNINKDSGTCTINYHIVTAPAKSNAK